MHNATATDRRSFLKTGALMAAPLAIAAPVHALADDGTRARLSRMEDERALAALTRDFLRQFNADAAKQCRSLLAEGCAITLSPNVQRLTCDSAIEDGFVLDKAGTGATTRLACTSHETQPFDGDTTIERIAHWQGHGFHHTQTQRALDLAFSKGKGGWQIVQLQMT